jgi:hypothetical protein
MNTNEIDANASDEIRRLANFIVAEIEGEPSEVDTNE